MPDPLILVLNGGSSSLKFGLYAERGGNEQAVLQGQADGIGQRGGKIELKDSSGSTLRSEDASFGSDSDALERAAQWIAEFSPVRPSAVGHRVVHGGPRLVAHQLVTQAVLQELESSLHYAPLHMPIALELIKASERNYPQIPQFACFDTQFHRSIPEVAARFPIPRDFFDRGIRRYGFHGISYESIVHQLGKDLPGRTVMAHLGSGASLAAVKEGRSMDTTMGLTPTGGIPMATRSGDLDPGVLLYLLRFAQMNAESLEKLLNHEAGLKGLSGGKQDMRDLESAAESGDGKAQLAIDAFCMAICKTIAAYAVEMGGLDMLVFTGGIGEHSQLVRGNVCRGLGFLGARLDEAANVSGFGTISAKDSLFRVCVVPSQEDLQIAWHCRRMMQAGGSGFDGRS